MIPTICIEGVDVVNEWYKYISISVFWLANTCIYVCTQYKRLLRDAVKENLLKIRHKRLIENGY